MGKDQALIGTASGGYEWVDRTDPRVTEVRLLHERVVVGTAGSGSAAADNLLVIGDAHDALLALSRIPEYADELRGKVKLIYIDPPFNTGQAFAQYDDALEHSTAGAVAVAPHLGMDSTHSERQAVYLQVQVRKMPCWVHHTDGNRSPVP